MAEPLLCIRDLQVDFKTETGSVTAVDRISFTLNRSEVLAIVGESGSGKTVTALSILQLLSKKSAIFKSGEILFSEDGISSIDLLNQPNSQLASIRGNQIAMIFQEPMTSLNPVFTCGYQVMETIRKHESLSKKQSIERTIALFEKVKLPDPANIFFRYPHQLSGGQKQRVMIAMAMSCQPSLLICDEPTTALDVTVQKTILQLIRELQQSEKMGVIFITHDLGVVSEIADRAAVMYKGKIVEEGNVEDILYHAMHPYTKGLMACRPVLHKKGERLPVVSDFMKENEEGMSEIKFEKSEDQDFREALIDNESTPLIDIKNLSVWFPLKKTFFGKTLDYTRAVDNISFQVHRGETLGLVGESGCGKTTLGRALLRLIEPTAGKIIYNNYDLATVGDEALKTLRKDIQIIFQDPYSSLNPKITIGAAIEEPLKVHNIYSGEKTRKLKVVELLEKVNLSSNHYERYPHEFSGGQRQRIVIARALALQPSFIVCDESVSALDVSVQAQVLNLINDLKKEFGFTIIFISHDLSVIRYMCDRVMVMQHGKIIETGDAESIYREPGEAYTKNLLDSIPGRHG